MTEENHPPRVTLKDHATYTGPLHFNTIEASIHQCGEFGDKANIIHLIQNNQFHGHSHENLYTHFSTFINICSTVCKDQSCIG